MDEPPKKQARKDHASESHASSSAKSVSRFPAPTGSPTMNKIWDQSGRTTPCATMLLRLYCAYIARGPGRSGHMT